MNDALVIAGKTYSLAPARRHRQVQAISRETRAAVDASGAQIVTVAIRRTNIGQNAQRAEPARRAAAVEVHLPAEYRRLLHRRTTRCARCASRASCSTATTLVKLEVLGDPHTLYPNMPETLTAAEDAGARTASR